MWGAAERMLKALAGVFFWIYLRRLREEEEAQAALLRHCRAQPLVGAAQGVALPHCEYCTVLYFFTVLYTVLCCV